MLAAVPRFDLAQLIDATRVAPALEFGGQPDLDHAIDRAPTNSVCRKTKNIGVIVPTAPFRVVFVLRSNRAYARMLVGRDVHSDAAAADQNSSIDSSIDNFFTHPGRKIRVIDAFALVRPQIVYLVTQLPQERYDPVLEIDSAMVIGD